MDPAGFCTQARVMIVAGKGGVGKTTVSAALARLAGRAGLRTLIVQVDRDSGLPALFGHAGRLDYRPTVLVPEQAGRPGSPATAQVSARTLAPDEALLEYLEDHGLRRISQRLSSSGTLEVVATAIPGIKDLLVLGKVKQLERRIANHDPDAPELIVVDAPPAGHAVTFLSSAHGVLDAVTVGPIRTQAAEVAEMITDPARCQVLLVTLPEETPVNEAIDTAFHLEDRAGIQLAPVVVNGLYPQLDLDLDAVTAGKQAGVALGEAQVRALDGAARFRLRQQALQGQQVERLARRLPLAQLHLPHVFTTGIDPEGLDVLSDALAAAVRALPEPS